MKVIKAPIAEKIPMKLIKHKDVREDNYYWLRLSDTEKDAEIPSEKTQKVLTYLSEENAFYEEETKHTLTFQEDLFQEMKSRIKEDDSSVPYFKNGYYYITRYDLGKQYPVYTRKKESLDAEEEVLLDVNVLAEGYEYFDVGGLSVTGDNKMLVYSTDETGRRQYTLRFKNLETGEVLKDMVEFTTGSATWSNDNQTLFYNKKDHVTLRSDKVYRHVLGTSTGTDVLVYHEKDETYNVYVGITKSKKYLMIGSYSTMQTEYQFLDANNPTGSFTLFQEREKDLEYSIMHYGDAFYILTNKDGATNFKLMKTPENATAKENWVDVIPHRDQVLLEDITIFKDFLVLEEREEGLSKIRIIRWDGSQDYYLPFSEETYAAYVYSNPEFDTEWLRYGYNSMTTPSSVIDFNMVSQEKNIKKEQEVLGGKFDKNNYTSQRIWVPARDGKKVALSIVHRKDIEVDENTPVLMYAYGSYGHTVDDSFSTTRLSLLDRGFVFALAHIRGSEYLGRAWYEDGKLLTKKNTFNDFVDCAKYLVNAKMTSPEHLYAMGGSAGGLLMGAVSNMNPELFNGIISAVPFVDVVTTMLDESIPLTTGEYDEWGNPNEKEYYDYIKSYSPYDNIEAKAYPNMLITTGLHDSQVQYWEPAKYIAKLRALKTDQNKLYLHTNMEAGHGGASGRFDALKEIAEEYTFILDLEGLVSSK
ncbi:S9 family peptidase [Wenyingzhuangia sp. 2_MG-2023]|uniref:S9 family peptidase n=1 Tax=Wenyingzhuangia sp. 2_MG-2023 TaxID=3062639 RepID=UPI0026E2A30C|nr:S9 family peptidase [Wenyingzhuangia sp. 2_MG-2023]MDO6738766.1 S9 family peptidase [Wenyingzhuangia sp. 2_MG-2023]